jgi:hypothetical protein
MDKASAGLELTPSPPPQQEHHRGEYHEQYLNAATDGIWGEQEHRCGGSTLVRYHADGTVDLVPALCGCWACRLCGPMRAAWLKRQIVGAVEHGQVQHFWTLTLRRLIDDPMPEDIIQANDFLTRSWNRLRTKLAALYGRHTFVWTREHTKAGWPHLHLLTSFQLEPGELSALWLEATGNSWIVDTQPADSQRAATYLAKYTTQEATSGMRPKYARAFSRSRDLVFESFRPHSEDPSAWSLVAKPYWLMARNFATAGREVIRQKLRGVPSCTIVDPPIAAGEMPAYDSPWYAVVASAGILASSPSPP